MARRADTAGKAQVSLPRLAVAALACGAMALSMPSAGLALVGKNASAEAASTLDSLRIGLFTPATVDPDLAARVADKARLRGIHFTPASAPPVTGNRTVTVAVRVDDDTARAVSFRKVLENAPGRSPALAGFDADRFQLGAARGYKSFARNVDLSANVRSLAMPDLAQFEPSKPKADDKPSRLQPRIEFVDREIAGRSPNTLDSTASQVVGVGGSFRLSKNLNVTAGVRYSQERERIDPVTNAVQDSQAVYVGTQIKF